MLLREPDLGLAPKLVQKDWTSKPWSPAPGPVTELFGPQVALLSALTQRPCWPAQPAVTPHGP